MTTSRGGSFQNTSKSNDHADLCDRGRQRERRNATAGCPRDALAVRPEGRRASPTPGNHSEGDDLESMEPRRTSEVAQVSRPRAKSISASAADGLGLIAKSAKDGLERHLDAG
jgi:hypothetical protein